MRRRRRSEPWPPDARRGPRTGRQETDRPPFLSRLAPRDGSPAGPTSRVGTDPADSPSPAVPSGRAATATVEQDGLSPGDVSRWTLADFATVDSASRPGA